MDMGLAAKEYRCWRLRLVGDHGKEARKTLSRLASIQAALKSLTADFAAALARYGAGERDVPLWASLLEAEKALDGLLERYRQLLASGEEAGLLRRSPAGMFSSRAVVSPILKKDDYTMMYDANIPGCPQRGAGPG